MQNMIVYVEGLVPDALAKGRANSLTAKLAAALRWLDKGKEDRARAKLNDFIDRVNAYIDSRILTSEQGQPLIDSAMNARNAIP